MAALQDVEAGHSKHMEPASEPRSPNLAGSLAGSTEAAARFVAAVVLPLVVGGGAALFNMPIIGLLAFPVLLGAWVGCMWLALSARHEQLEQKVRDIVVTQLGLPLECYRLEIALWRNLERKSGRKLIY